MFAKETKMNEKIKQLAEQAGYRPLPGFDFANLIEETYLKKFAELIVKECADIGDNYQDILGNEPECFNCRKVAYGIVDKIREHFGVEE
jgi:hypothetical protein